MPSMMDSSDIQQLVDNQIITAAAAAKLADLLPGKCCRHKSWGPGKVKSWDTLAGKMHIDFVDKSNHPMELEYAAQSLRPLPDDHIESKIVSDLAHLKTLASSDPVALMVTVVGSMGRQATVERIEMILSGTVVEKAAWKKWWDSAKKALKKDGRFEVPARRTIPIVFHDTPPDRGALAIDTICSSSSPKEILLGLEKLTKNWKPESASDLDRVLAAVDAVLEKLPSSQVHAGIELVLARQEFVSAADAGDPHASHALDRFLPKNPRAFVEILEGLPSAKQKRAVEFARKAWKEEWETLAPRLLSVGNAKVCEEVIGTYREAGKSPELLAILERLISERKLHYDFIHWLCKNRKGEFRPLINHNLLATILSVLEFEQLGGSRKASKLERLLLTDKDLVRDLLESASDEQVRDVTRNILSSPAFEELDKRSFLAALVKLYPFVQEMITKAIVGGGGQPRAASEPSSVLIVSWESLKRRQAELEELVTKKIPENSKEIAVARSYGDLKENHEFKSAKEMQTVLMRRKAELEAELAAAQGTDFRNPDTSKVNIGTVVTVVDTETNKSESFTILGAWDGDPERGVLSYKTVVAQALLHKTPGAEVSLTLESGGTRKVRVESIAAFNQ